jgi:FtsZ-binding cell division protein ZapB
MVGELQAELLDYKEKLRIMTQKFSSTRKERDQLKQENKELQQEIISL